jgi:hypothetical protein
MKYAWSRAQRDKRRKDWLEKHASRFRAESSIPANQVTVVQRKEIPPLLEYYTGAFAWLHKTLFETYKYGIDAAMRMRRSFWHLVPDGIYGIHQAHDLIDSYAEVVERKLAEEISTHSIIYWMHVYRRLAPGAAGPHDSANATILVRQRLEAAIQKYAVIGDDPAIGWSDELKAVDVLSQIPVEFRPPEMINLLLDGPRQTLLTNFDMNLWCSFTCANSSLTNCGSAEPARESSAKALTWS